MVIDFFVLGAVKAGTTSLHHYLKQHPQLEMSAIKWTRFFHVASERPDFQSLAGQYGATLLNESTARYRLMCNSRVPSSLENYFKNWDFVRSGVVRGEISPTYMYDKQACLEIRRLFPRSKALVVLREPVRRAISHFVMDRANGWVPDRTIQESFSLEPWQVDNFWWGLRHYLRHGLYSRYFRYLKEIFPAGDLAVFFYEDLVSRPLDFMNSVTDFLEVDRFAFDFSLQHNKAPLEKPVLSAREREIVSGFFEVDRCDLKSLLSLDFSAWNELE